MIRIQEIGMTKDLSTVWVEKYSPFTIEDYVFQDEMHERAFRQMIDKQSISHLLLSGSTGSGKTTLSKILVHELGIDDDDVLLIWAADENSVEVMREKIKSFVSTCAMGFLKIVQLEESDRISAAAQKILLRLMDEYSDSSRFILTCNHENKIIPELRSRCQIYRFNSFDKGLLADRIVDILLREEVKFEDKLILKYIDSGYPDVRKIINTIQQNVIDGELHPPKEIEVGDYKFNLLGLLESDDWIGIRKLLCSNVSPEEWEGVYRFLYENLNKSEKFSARKKWEEGIIVIADHLYKHSLVADAEINAAAMFITLTNL